MLHHKLSQKNLGLENRHFLASEFKLMTFYTYVSCLTESQRICEELASERLIALDTETTGLHIYEGARVRLVQIGTPAHAYVFDLWKLGAGGFEAVKELLSA